MCYKFSDRGFDTWPIQINKTFTMEVVTHKIVGSRCKIATIICYLTNFHYDSNLVSHNAILTKFAISTELEHILVKAEEMKVRK